ncbi:MAG: dethiobiotin synthase [Opitutaceae bacterium]|jgi:8-amino-7-oxononanoate synthase
MRTLLVNGSDTGVGKTRVVAALARLLSGQGGRIQIVKVVETGVAHCDEGDALRAWRMAGTTAEAFTLFSYEAALAPLAAAAAEGRRLTLDKIVAALESLPDCDWRIIEGAGGVAVPISEDGGDWTDLAKRIEDDPHVILVIPNRLGAINQGRMAHAFAASRDISPWIWLNTSAPVDKDVAASNISGLTAAGIAPLAIQRMGALLPDNPSAVLASLEEELIGRGASTATGGPMPHVGERCRDGLEERAQRGLRRSLRVSVRKHGELNLADNDYLDLSQDASVAAAVARSVFTHGTSAASSPLITGWRPPHAQLCAALCDWHAFPHGLLWSSGYAANAAILGELPQRGDLVLADRLIHHSMIAGLTRSGARLRRYAHLRLDQLETELEAAAGRTVFVVTESVFSMDGDYPDLRRLAELKRRFGFFWILDEAHALGWYGETGAGLASAAGVAGSVDVLVGTLGKTLASGGAYSLFRDEGVRDHLVNHAGEFIYSTGLSLPAVAAAEAALCRVRALVTEQCTWHATSRRFRERLAAEGWNAPAGESPVVPVNLGGADEAVSLAEALRAAGILVAAVRPPTVPAGTSRLRFSLKRTFTNDDATRVLAAMNDWRSAR